MDYSEYYSYFSYTENLSSDALLDEEDQFQKELEENEEYELQLLEESEYEDEDEAGIF